jgi:hypothetical protein
VSLLVREPKPRRLAAGAADVTPLDIAVAAFATVFGLLLIAAGKSIQIFFASEDKHRRLVVRARAAN